MHRRISAAIVSAVLILGAAPALADSQREFKGEITSIDRHSQSIVVKGGEPQRRLKFFLARGGQVKSAGTAVTFKDLSPGAQVEVAYTKSGSTQWARTIGVVGEDESKAVGLTR